MTELITIATYDDNFAANVALGRLQSSGIRAILNNMLMSEVWNLPGAEYTQIRLLVNPEDEERARAILADVSE